MRWQPPSRWPPPYVFLSSPILRPLPSYPELPLPPADRTPGSSDSNACSGLSHNLCVLGHHFKGHEIRQPHSVGLCFEILNLSVNTCIFIWTQFNIQFSHFALPALYYLCLCLFSEGVLRVFVHSLKIRSDVCVRAVILFYRRLTVKMWVKASVTESYCMRLVGVVSLSCPCIPHIYPLCYKIHLALSVPTWKRTFFFFLQGEILGF